MLRFSLGFFVILNIFLLSTAAENSCASLSRQLEQQKTALQELKQLLQNYQNSGYGSLLDVRSSAHSPSVHQRLPRSCAEALQHRSSNSSGIYQLYLPNSGLKPFYVYCLQDLYGGPAWTLLQRREDGSEDFYRNWQEYKRGFGNLYKEFFIGLDKLYALTSEQLNELWVQMEDFEGVQHFAKYETFAVGDEDSKYALNVMGKFSGDAGDSLLEQSGQKFSTKDADNDSWDQNCAETYNGAWWYAHCHSSNLNGLYLRGNYGKENFGKGINWRTWRGHNYSLKYVHMAIRPVK